MACSISVRSEVGLFAVVLAGLWMVAACASMQPYEPRNHREEGPERGILTGAAGEFVIERPGAEAPR